MRNRHHAFSLVELLVVIGIIGLLVAILMPALTRARAQARQVYCASQLRQIGIAFYNYAAGNHGNYPAYGNWQVWGGDGTGQDDDATPGWTEELIPYFTNNPIIYNCPDFPEGYPFNYFMEVRWLILQNRWNWKATEIHNTTEFVLCSECTHSKLYPEPWGQALHTLPDCDKDDAMWKSLSFRGEQSGFNAHHGGNNILFADGHVACFAKFDPQQMTFHPKGAGVDWEDVTAP